MTARRHRVCAETHSGPLGVDQTQRAPVTKEQPIMTTTNDTPTAAPLAVNHTIDGLGLELRPDGELTLEHHPRPFVRLTPREAYALLMFMRSPSVVALLEAQNALRMTESELSFQNDPETIAELAAQKKQTA